MLEHLSTYVWLSCLILLWVNDLVISHTGVSINLVENK